MSRSSLGPTQPSSSSSWLAAVQADQVACRLACETVRVLLPLAKVAAAVIDGELWRGCGYSPVHDFTREELERSSKWLRMHAALHRAVVKVPGLRGAVTGEDGGAPIGMSKALLVARVASMETLGLWVERARRLTVDELREAVSGGGEVEAAMPVPGTEDIAEVPRIFVGLPSAAVGARGVRQCARSVSAAGRW